MRKKELDLFNDDASARFLWWACYWDLGEDGGPVVRKETHRMDRNGIAMHDGALDVGSDVELGTRCSIHKKERTHDMNELVMVCKSRSYDYFAAKLIRGL